MTDLFRREVFVHQQQKHYGSIVLPASISFSLASAAAVLIITGMVAFFFLAGFARTETVNGVIVPIDGVIRIYPPATGVVIERQAKEGQLVKAGDVLFTLSGERASESKGNTLFAIKSLLEGRIVGLRDELAKLDLQLRQQRLSTESRLKQIKQEIDQLGKEVALQERRVEIAKQTEARYLDLRKSNFISDAIVQEKTADFIEQQGKMANLERAQSTLKRDFTTLDGDYQDLPLRTQREASTIRRSIAELEQQLADSESRRSIVITAPKDGFVTAISAEPGQMIPAGQMIAQILPNSGDVEVELYAPSRSVGFLKANTPVLIRYQAFPYQKFGQHTGAIREISRSAIQSSEIQLPITKDSSSEPLYRIRVHLDRQTVRAFGEERALEAGMQLQATLNLEYRKLYEWVLEPLYSISGRFSR